MVKPCLVVADIGVSKLAIPSEAEARPEHHREFIAAIGMWIEYEALT